MSEEERGTRLRLVAEEVAFGLLAENLGVHGGVAATDSRVDPRVDQHGGLVGRQVLGGVGVDGWAAGAVPADADCRVVGDAAAVADHALARGGLLGVGDGGAEDDEKEGVEHGLMPSWPEAGFD